MGTCVHVYPFQVLHVCMCVCLLQSAILGESNNRFSLNLGSNNKSMSPHSTIAVSVRGIHDLAASPCGTRIAAACCDGSLRIYDVASGSLLGGCQSYYGALQCCMFSPDGRCVHVVSPTPVTPHPRPTPPLSSHVLVAHTDSDKPIIKQSRPA